MSRVSCFNLNGNLFLFPINYCIIQVKWYNENYYHDLHSPYDLKLASANIHGHVMIWEIREGKLLNDFVEQQRLPTCLEWLSGHEVSHDLLLVLYNPNLLILWNADTGVRLWKKTFSDTVVQITVDPFNSSNMTGSNLIWLYFNDVIQFAQRLVVWQ